MSGERPIPEATVGRLPLYLRALADLVAAGTTTVSSASLATASGVTPAKVRKDLSHLGSFGTRGVGYDVAVLGREVRRALGLTEDRRVAIVGVGNLGHALARYRGFAERGFRPVALLDADPAKVGEVVDGIRVRPIAELGAAVRGEGVAIGVICTPALEAQAVADALVAAGVRTILNFAPVVLDLPEGVVVRKVDLAVELQILTYYGQRPEREARDPGRRRPTSRS